MNAKSLRMSVLLLAATSAGPALSAQAPTVPVVRDGSHDFDWEIGVWNTKLRRKPLGSDTWVSYTGSSTVRGVWDGRSNMVELIVNAPDGQVFRGANWRLYNPETRQWSTNYANASVGVISTPGIGEFKNGVGEFYDQEELAGRYRLVKFVMSNITPTTAHFEQFFSIDGGRTWDLNWVADDTRVGPPPKTFVPPGY